jgi:hypothetical protein
MNKLNDVIVWTSEGGKNLGSFENIDKLNTFLVERFRVSNNLSIRTDVVRREILDKLNDNYISCGKVINLDDLIFVIISCEKYELAIDPDTALKVSSRLHFHGYL